MLFKTWLELKYQLYNLGVTNGAHVEVQETFFL